MVNIMGVVSSSPVVCCAWHGAHLQVGAQVEQETDRAGVKLSQVRKGGFRGPGLRWA